MGEGKDPLKRETVLRSGIPVGSSTLWKKSMSGKWRDIRRQSTLESNPPKTRRSPSPEIDHDRKETKFKQQQGAGLSVIRWIKTLSGSWDSPRKGHRRCSSGNPLFGESLSDIDEADLELLKEEQERLGTVQGQQAHSETEVNKVQVANKESMIEVIFSELPDSDDEFEEEDHALVEEIENPGPSSSMSSAIELIADGQRNYSNLSTIGKERPVDCISPKVSVSSTENFVDKLPQQLSGNTEELTLPVRKKEKVIGASAIENSGEEQEGAKERSASCFSNSMSSFSSTVQVQVHPMAGAVYSHKEELLQTVNDQPGVSKDKWMLIPFIPAAPLEHKETVENLWDMVSDADDQDSEVEYEEEEEALLPPPDQLDIEEADSSDIAETLLSLSKTFQSIEMWQEVGELCNAALEVSNLCGEPNETVADALQGMAKCAFEGAHYTRAARLYNRSIQEYSTALTGGTTPRVAHCMCGFALTLWNLGRVDEAEKQYLEVIQISQERSQVEKAKADEGVDRSMEWAEVIGRARCDLGLLLADLGRFEEALAVYTVALAESHKALEVVKDGEKQEIIKMNTAELLHNLGDLHGDLGNFEASFASYEKTLEIKHDIFGYSSISVATTLNNFTVALSESGRLAEALERAEQCLQLKTQLLDNHSMDVMISECNWLDIQCDAIQTNCVSPFITTNKQLLLRRAQVALQIFKQITGEISSETSFGFKVLGQAYMVNGLLDKAEDAFQNAISSNKPSTSWEEAVNTSAKHCLGELYLKKGFHKKAKKLLVAALSFREKQFGADSYLATKSRVALSNCS